MLSSAAETAAGEEKGSRNHIVQIAAVVESAPEQVRLIASDLGSADREQEM
jgi:hypothetical protein